VSKLTNQWIELFRAGNHGEKGEFTSADLDQIVANYRPDTEHEAPATIGHPKSDAPAFGWFDAVKRQGTTLLGKMREVQPEFEEMVEKKLFKKRSVGLVKGESGWALHHVAFLGAQAPHIKGLADCKFQGEASQVIEIEFQESTMAVEDTFIARLNVWFDDKFGKNKPNTTIETTTATFSEADVKRIAGEAVAAAVAPLQAELVAQKTTFAESQQRITTAETKGRAIEAINKIKADGRWVPAFDKIGLPLVFDELAKVTTTVEFGEGSEKKAITPLDALVAFMEKLPKIVPNASVYTGQSTTQPGANTSNINPGSRTVVDPNSLSLHQFAEARSKEKNISYADALLQVASEKPELTVAGGAASGAV
jgi:hypothetical protein